MDRTTSGSGKLSKDWRLGGLLAVGMVAALLTAAAPASAEDAPDAAKLWTKNCQSCHGPDGKGKTKMGEKAHVEDLTAADVKAKLTEAKAAEAIKNGIKEKDDPSKFAMKAYGDKLSAAEIEALAKHSLTFK